METLFWGKFQRDDAALDTRMKEVENQEVIIVSSPLHTSEMT